MTELETARNDPPTQPANSVATRIVALLAEEGYRPHLEEPEGPFRRAGHDTQAEAKVAKFFLDPACKFYEMQAELFLGGHPLNAQHLEKCVYVLRRAAAAFSERLTTEAPRARA
jgi:hypothetical protein